MDETGITGFDPDAVHTKYLAERDKRLVAGRAIVGDELEGLARQIVRGADRPFLDDGVGLERFHASVYRTKGESGVEI